MSNFGQLWPGGAATSNDGIQCKQHVCNEYKRETARSIGGERAITESAYFSFSTFNTFKSVGAEICYKFSLRLEAGSAAAGGLYVRVVELET